MATHRGRRSAAVLLLSTVAATALAAPALAGTRPPAGPAPAGLSVTPAEVPYEPLRGAAVDSRGRLLTVGTVSHDEVARICDNGMGVHAVDIRVHRHRPDGTADTTFGTRGTAVLPTTGLVSGAAPLGVVVTPGDHPVIAVRTSLYTPTCVRSDVLRSEVVRLTVGGRLDTSFGDSGHTLVGNGGYFRGALAAAPDGGVWLTDDGGIVGVDGRGVVGRRVDPRRDRSVAHDSPAAVASSGRLVAYVNGPPGAASDWRLSVLEDSRPITVGLPVLPAARQGRWSGFAVTAVDALGRVLVAFGTERASDDRDPQVTIVRYRRTSAGYVQDSTWNGGRPFVQAALQRRDYLYDGALAVDSGGRVVLSVSGEHQSLLLRVTAQGRLDPTFHGGRLQVLPMTADGGSLTLDGADRPLLPGTDALGRPAFRRYTSRGEPDPALTGVR